MGYIWKTAFDDDYQQEYAFLSESEDAQTINVGFTKHIFEFVSFEYRNKIGGEL